LFDFRRIEKKKGGVFQAMCPSKKGRRVTLEGKTCAPTPMAKEEKRIEKKNIGGGNKNKGLRKGRGGRGKEGFTDFEGKEGAGSGGGRPET